MVEDLTPFGPLSFQGEGEDHVFEGRRIGLQSLSERRGENSSHEKIALRLGFETEDTCQGL